MNMPASLNTYLHTFRFVDHTQIKESQADKNHTRKSDKGVHFDYNNIMVR